VRLTEAEYEALIARRSAERVPVAMPVPVAPEKRASGPESEVTITLPWPPSTNTIWRSLRAGPMAGRVLLSKAGREYFRVAADSVREQCNRQTFVSRLGVELILHPPTKRAFDIDNRCKAALDACTKGGLWVDDDQIDVLIVRRAEVVTGGRLVVRAWRES